MALSRFHISEPNANYNQWSILARDGNVLWAYPITDLQYHANLGYCYACVIDGSDSTYTSKGIVPSKFLYGDDGFKR